MVPRREVNTPPQGTVEDDITRERRQGRKVKRLKQHYRKVTTNKECGGFVEKEKNNSKCVWLVTALLL